MELAEAFLGLWNCFTDYFSDFFAIFSAFFAAHQSSLFEMLSIFKHFYDFFPQITSRFLKTRSWNSGSLQVRLQCEICSVI